MNICGYEITSIAEDEEIELEGKKQEQEKLHERIALDSHYKSVDSGVPRKYWNESIETYLIRGDNEKINLERVKRFINYRNNKVLILCGNNGTGKTMLGCSVIRERGGVYKPMLKLVYEVDSSMSFKASKSKIQLLDELCTEPMLVLDEVGRGVQQEKQAELLYYIINERYGNMLPTVLISNLKKIELVRFLGEAVKDRLNETCEYLEFTGDSYRKELREMADVEF